MANITPQEIFPSAKFISTDAVGDLQEVHGLPPKSASLIADKLLIEAVQAGADGNNITFELVDSNRPLPVSAIAEQKASFVFDSKVKFEAVSAGVAGNSLQVRINLNSDPNDPTMKVAKNGDKIVIEIKQDANGDNLTSSNFVSEFASVASDAVKALYSVTEVGSGILTTHNSGLQNLSGGVDAVDAVPSQNAIFTLSNQTDIVCDVRKINNGGFNTANAIAQDFVNSASDEIKALVNISTLSIQDSPTMSSHTIAKTNLSGGEDEQTNQELDSDSTYLMIKTSDINHLESTEQGDGRKLMYGIIDKANDSFSVLADKPINLKISNSSPIFNSSTNTIFKSYLVETFLSFQGLDVKDES